MDGKRWDGDVGYNGCDDIGRQLNTLSGYLGFKWSDRTQALVIDRILWRIK